MFTFIRYVSPFLYSIITSKRINRFLCMEPSTTNQPNDSHFKTCCRNLHSGMDIIPLLGTFLCCLFLGIEIGLCCGVGIDALLLMYYHSRPPLDVQYVDVSIFYDDLTEELSNAYLRYITTVIEYSLQLLPA